LSQQQGQSKQIMKPVQGIFRSRFARRLFAVFVLSAILPVIALAAITFNRVSDQLLLQNQDHQELAAKSLGLALYDRLVMLSAELELIESRRSRLVESADSAMSQRLIEKFRSLGQLGSNGEVIPLPAFEQIKMPGTIPSNLRDSGTNNAIDSLQNDAGQMQIFISHLSDSGEMIAGEINPDYLWGVTDAADVNYGICILGHAGLALFCNDAAPAALTDVVAAQGSESFSDYVEWMDPQGQAHLASYWSVFLADQFGIDDWMVITSLPRQLVLRPITDFQNTFLLVIAITLLLVFLLSSSQIRHILTPLRQLTNAFKAVGDTNFEHRVEIDSNDEFEDLADSFNTMGMKLADQFNSLETMAEIDRLILSSQDAENIVRIVLIRIQDIIHSDQIGIAAQDTEGEFNTMFVRSSHHQQEEEVLEVKIEVRPQDYDLLNSNSKGVVLGFGVLPGN
jgi:HAMP domain-containing protein